MEQPTAAPKIKPRLAGKSMRTRPLRTYSKRTSSTETADPLPKKRRIEATSTITAPEDGPAEISHQPNVPHPSPTLPPSQPAKKGTITGYFKVLPPSSNSILDSSEPPSGSVEPSSTPPSSPPISDRQPKKRRRLTTRVVSRSVSEDPQIEDVDRDRENEESNTVDDRSAVSEGCTNVLLDASSDILNRPIARHKTRSDAGKCGRGPKSATVQTTLSLSAAEKGFTECKACNMLYNPLHKQDAKCHARRHAAMLKARASSNDDEALN